MVYLIRPGAIPDGLPGENSKIVFYDNGKPRQCDLTNLGNIEGIGLSTSQITITTNPLEPGASQVINEVISKYFVISQLSTNYPAWVRIYRDNDYLTADNNRPINQDVTGNHGLILETITNNDNLTIDLSPIVTFVSSDNNSDLVPIKINNLDTTHRTIQLNLVVYR